MENNNSTITSFDNMTYSNNLQILKTLFPYVPPTSQKLLSSYIKVSELSIALNMCSGKNPASLSACSDDRKKTPLELLSEIKNYCTKKEQDNIDMALNFYSAFQMYQTFMEAEKETVASQSEHTSNSNSQGEGKKTSIIELFKNMLTPEQQSAFDNYQLLFNAAE